jgi:hypothetical protein
MKEIILDISANTTKNDNEYVKNMIDQIKLIDTGKHKIIFKPQLFDYAGDNIVMKHRHFKYIYNYCQSVGYQCTASVFDEANLDFILGFDVPFIKIACRDDLRYLIDEIPRRIPVYYSVDTPYFKDIYNSIQLVCIPKYPALVYDYEKLINKIQDEDCYYNFNGISDYTQGFELFNNTQFGIHEFHYALEDSTGLDAESGVCKTPKMLKEIL